MLWRVEVLVYYFLREGFPCWYILVYVGSPGGNLGFVINLPSLTNHHEAACFTCQAWTCHKYFNVHGTQCFKEQTDATNKTQFVVQSIVEHNIVVSNLMHRVLDCVQSIWQHDSKLSGCLAARQCGNGQWARCHRRPHLLAISGAGSMTAETSECFRRWCSSAAPYGSMWSSSLPRLQPTPLDHMLIIIVGIPRKILKNWPHWYSPRWDGVR